MITAGGRTGPDVIENNGFNIANRHSARIHHLGGSEVLHSYASRVEYESLRVI